MKIHRFITSFNRQGTRAIVTDPMVIQQMRTVLRLSVGESVSFLTTDAHEITGSIVEITISSVQIEVSAERHAEQFVPRVLLCCALLKRENFELVTQKATEVGVDRIIPIITDRTIKQDMKRDRVIRIIHEAVEQSGRLTIPQLETPSSLADALRASHEYEERWFFDTATNAQMIGNALSAGSIAVFIGPEGGWASREIAMAQEYKCTLTSLGSSILRAETAAIVASYMAIRMTTVRS